MIAFRILLTIVLALVAQTGFADIYTVETGQFEKLRINGNIKVVYKNLPDSTGYARYEASDGGEDYFKFSTKDNGTLRIEPSDEKWGQLNLPTVYVYSDFITSVESYSELSVDLVSIAPCSTFNVTLIGNGEISVDGVRCNTLKASIKTGNGSIYLSGECVNANFKMVGAGLISADRLEAGNVKCSILGTGSIGCWPIDNLNVAGIGTTKIYYKGRPNIKKTGGGKLFELPEDHPVEKVGAELKTLRRPVNNSKRDIEDSADYPYNYPTVVTEDD